MVTFSRGKAKVDVVSDRASESVSKEAAFARESFDAIASKVVSVGFFELPRSFASNVDGTYEVVTVHTQGLSKQVIVMLASKPPAGLVELLETFGEQPEISTRCTSVTHESLHLSGALISSLKFTL